MGNASPRLSWRNVLLLTAILLIPLGLYSLWQCWPALFPKSKYGDSLTGYLKRLNNLTKLDARYTDADNDLVADTPSDASQLLDPAEIVFAPIAGSPRDTQEIWQPFLEHLQKTSGKKVRFEKFRYHRTQLDALKEGKVQVTAFGTGFVPAAVNGSGFVPQCALAKADGSFTYQMLIVVRKSSPIQTVSDLRGKRLAMTSAGSLSGFKT